MCGQESVVGAFSVWHWLVVLIVAAIFVYPVWRIVSKAGYAGAWALLWFVPLVNIIALWVFAFAQWPVQRGTLSDEALLRAKLASPPGQNG